MARIGGKGLLRRVLQISGLRKLRSVLGLVVATLVQEF